MNHSLVGELDNFLGAFLRTDGNRFRSRVDFLNRAMNDRGRLRTEKSGRADYQDTGEYFLHRILLSRAHWKRTSSQHRSTQALSRSSHVPNRAIAAPAGFVNMRNDSAYAAWL